MRPIRMLRGWLDSRDRAEIFTVTADAASRRGLAYWVVLVIAGSIAVLGLALNSPAVVIGAMLIAPLLAPVVGLAMALAVGDGALALETAAVIFLSTLAVVVTGALLALTLPIPFQTLTNEVASRIRPTTLDLAVAAFSGLAGASVTVARKSKLAGAIPGVAVAVALVPPLAAAGYGIGIGWNWTIVRGSLLLYGANLAGIVMSAMVLFMIAGMRHPEVLEVDARWREERRDNLSTWINRIPGLRSLGIMRSIWARIGLVAAFVALVAIPLRVSLGEIAREVRIKRAIADATRIFTTPGRSFIVSQQVNIGSEGTNVVLNVATTRWFTEAANSDFERRASSAADEPITLTLEQVPASNGNLSELASLLGAQRPRAPGVGTVKLGPPANVSALRAAIASAIGEVPLPDSVTIIGSDFILGDSLRRPELQLTYTSPAALSPQAQQIIEKTIAGTLALPRLRVVSRTVDFAGHAVTSANDSFIDSAATLLRRFPRISVDMHAGGRAPPRLIDSITARLVRLRVVPDTISSAARRSRIVSLNFVLR